MLLATVTVTLRTLVVLCVTAIFPVVRLLMLLLFLLRPVETVDILLCGKVKGTLRFLFPSVFL